MTTTVHITACCDDKTEVNVCITETDELVEDVTIQNGETLERHVYDDRMISIREVDKEDIATEDG